MYCIVNNNGGLDVYADKPDLCYKCKNFMKCPLVIALTKEYVFLHYSDIEVKECPLFKK